MSFQISLAFDTAGRTLSPFMKFVFKGKRKSSVGRKCCHWLACADCTGLYVTTFYAHGFSPVFPHIGLLTICLETTNFNWFTYLVITFFLFKFVHTNNAWSEYIDVSSLGIITPVLTCFVVELFHPHINLKTW